jgi:hypothetical protein
MEDAWFGGLWAGKEVCDGFELFAEVHAEIPDHRYENLFVNVGAKFALDERTSLMFSAGIDALSTPGQGHAATVFLGLQFNF